MLTKETKTQIEVLESGHIQIREASYILENGVRISGPTYHRTLLPPGADIATASERVQQIAAVVWTPDVVATEKARKNAAVGPDGTRIVKE